MPIPRYERRVAPTALPGVQPQGGMPDIATAAPAVSQFAQQNRDLAAAEKKRADEAATQDAWAKMVQTRNKMTYDPKTGLASRTGKSALDAEAVLLPEFDQATDSIAEGLGNDVQKAMFKSLRDRERLEFQGHITQHTFREIQNMEEQAFKSALGTAIDDGILNYRQPGKVAKTRKGLAAMIDNRADQMGWSPEVREQAKAEAVSQMHRGIFDRELANSNVPAAEQAYLLAKGSKEATGRDLTYMEDKLQPAKQQYADRLNIEAAQGISDLYMLRYRDAGAARQDMEQEHGDKPYYKALLSEFNRKFKEREDRDQFEYNAKAYELVDAALQGKPLDSTLMSTLEENDRRKVVEYSEAVAQWGAKNVSESGDSYLFLRKKAYEDPEWFMRANLIGYKLPPDELKAMRNLQLGMQNKSDKAREELDGIASQQDRLNAAADSLRYRNPEERRSFELTVDKEVLAFERRYKRKMEPKEFQDLVDQIKIDLRAKKRKLIEQ